MSVPSALRGRAQSKAVIQDWSDFIPKNLCEKTEPTESTDEQMHGGLQKSRASVVAEFLRLKSQFNETLL